MGTKRSGIQQGTADVSLSRWATDRKNQIQEKCSGNDRDDGKLSMSR
jgi:hypothetical protein